MKITSLMNNHLNYNRTVSKNQISTNFGKIMPQRTQADTVSFSSNILPKGTYNETKALYNGALALLQEALEKSKTFEFKGQLFSNNAKEMYISSPVMKTPKGEDCWLEFAPSRPYMRYMCGPVHISYEDNQAVTAIIRKNGKTECYSVFPDRLKDANFSGGKLAYVEKPCLTFKHHTKGVNLDGRWYLTEDQEGKDIKGYYANSINAFQYVTKAFIDLMNKK